MFSSSSSSLLSDVNVPLSQHPNILSRMINDPFSLSLSFVSLLLSVFPFLFFSSPVDRMTGFQKHGIVILALFVAFSPGNMCNINQACAQKRIGVQQHSGCLVVLYNIILLI